MWINFRKPRIFDDAARKPYFELFMQIPQMLEGIQATEAAQSLAEHKIREKLRVDLHDHTLQELIALGVWLTSIRENISLGETEEALRCLSTAATILEAAEDETRKHLDDLHYAPSPSGIGDSLHAWVARLRAEYEAPEVFRVEGLDKIPVTLYDSLYPILREAVTNAAKHGRASRIYIQAEKAGDTLQLVVTDNGHGFIASDENYGYGIRAMQSRVRWLKGTISIGSKEGQGTGIIIEIPLSKKVGD